MRCSGFYAHAGSCMRNLHMARTGVGGHERFKAVDNIILWNLYG